MKLTVEHYDEKVSIERESDDIDFTEFMGLVIRAAHAVGYSDKTINKYFNQERWNAIGINSSIGYYQIEDRGYLLR